MLMRKTLAAMSSHVRSQLLAIPFATDSYPRLTMPEFKRKNSAEQGQVSLPREQEGISLRRCNLSKPTGTVRQFAFPELVDTRKAAQILGRSPATLKRWRCEGAGPSWIEIEGRVSYDVAVLLDYIRKSTRTPSVRAMLEDASELLRKKGSKFY